MSATVKEFGFARSKPKKATTVQEKFVATRQEMADALIEREGEIDLVLTALINQEHPLLVGPPGTAKSLLLDSLMDWMGGKKFAILFTKFTTPEEVFGPISVMGLKADVYKRVTTGKLPEADAALADEIFKASSAILNTLLRILNERTFENGAGMAKVPLKICVAASNEWPQDQDGGKELGALFDRFLFRKHVKPIVGMASRRRLLWERDHTPKFSTSITPAEIDQAHAEALALPWTDEAKHAFEAILKDLGKEGIFPGDRRQYKSVAAAQSFAYLNGATQVEPEHLEILAHTLWDDPNEQPAKVAAVVGRVANPVGMEVTKHLGEVDEILAGTNVADAREYATADAKLSDILKRLSILKGNGRLEKAIEYIREQQKQLRLAHVNLE